MKIIIGPHTATNLYFRNIDGWKVKEVVKSASWKQAQKDGSMAARKTFEGKELEVIYVEYTNRVVVKTAYYVD